jgi:hypothetical protein
MVMATKPDQPEKIRVRIKKCTWEMYWYGSQIGNEFDVIQHPDFDYMYELAEGTYNILKSDCEVINQPGGGKNPCPYCSKERPNPVPEDGYCQCGYPYVYPKYIEGKTVEQLQVEQQTQEGKKEPDYAMYDEILPIFMRFMRKELEANFGKGDRNGKDGWLAVKDKKFWISELYYHVGKLQSALKADDIYLIQEYTADIANLAMMVLDTKVDLIQGNHISVTSAKVNREKAAEMPEEVKLAAKEYWLNNSHRDTETAFVDGYKAALSAQQQTIKELREENAELHRRKQRALDLFMSNRRWLKKKNAEQAATIATLTAELEAVRKERDEANEKTAKLERLLEGEVQYRIKEQYFQMPEVERAHIPPNEYIDTAWQQFKQANNI